MLGKVALAYQVLAGDWALSSSGAYVVAQADPLTERGDIDSWSVGFDATRSRLSIGGAYVYRGDSNSLVRNLDEDEWNLGVAWRADRWGLAASGSITQSTEEENRLVGIGGYFDINQWWVIRADAVAINEELSGGETRDGHVGILETSFRF